MVIGLPQMPQGNQSQTGQSSEDRHYNAFTGDQIMLSRTSRSEHVYVREQGRYSLCSKGLLTHLSSDSRRCNVENDRNKLKIEHGSLVP